ncbi:hypothetical protein J8J27_28315, partial [Mycobacterium tuberculosis]|nr:hypothetical protein [Mycobacterium tuberculosis]
ALGALDRTISVNPEGTLAALLALLLPTLAAVAALMIFDDDAAAARLWTFLVGFGAVLAAGGIVQDLAAPRTLLIFEKTSYVGDLTLSFV